MSEIAEAEIDRLRRDCAEAYQAVGVILAKLVGGGEYPPAAVRLLDNLWAAANGHPRTHQDLLPFSLDDDETPQQPV